MLSFLKIRAFCLQKKEAQETYPFGEEIAVFKVAGKIFLITDLRQDAATFHIKASPSQQQERRTLYPDHVRPAYHMNKRHWSMVVNDGTLPDDLLKDWITISYQAIIAQFPKKKQNLLL